MTLDFAVLWLAWVLESGDLGAASERAESCGTPWAAVFPGSPVVSGRGGPDWGWLGRLWLQVPGLAVWGVGLACFGFSLMTLYVPGAVLLT